MALLLQNEYKELEQKKICLCVCVCFSVLGLVTRVPCLAYISFYFTFCVQALSFSLVIDKTVNMTLLSILDRGQSLC